MDEYPIRQRWLSVILWTRLQKFEGIADETLASLAYMSNEPMRSAQDVIHDVDFEIIP